MSSPLGCQGFCPRVAPFDEILHTFSLTLPMAFGPRRSLFTFPPDLKTYVIILIFYLLVITGFDPGLLSFIYGPLFLFFFEARASRDYPPDLSQSTPGMSLPSVVDCFFFQYPPPFIFLLFFSPIAHKLHFGFSCLSFTDHLSGRSSF